jgi:hypothetical protein
VRDLGPADGSPLAGPVREELPSELAGGSGRLRRAAAARRRAGAGRARGARGRDGRAAGDPRSAAATGKDGGTGGGGADARLGRPRSWRLPPDGQGTTTATSAPRELRRRCAGAPATRRRAGARPASGSAPDRGARDRRGGRGLRRAGRQAAADAAALRARNSPAASLTVPSDRVDAERGPDSKNGGGAAGRRQRPAPGRGLTPSLVPG